MSSDELLCTRKNWNRVILEGRKPGQTIGIGCDDTREPLATVGKALFDDLRRVAEVLDSEAGNQQYQQVCDELVAAFDDPELTFSARILQAMKAEGIGSVGLRLAEQYRKILTEEALELLTAEQLAQEQKVSWQRQYELEASDTLSFDEFLKANGGN
jgi:glutamate--cysteine ligase